MKKRALQAISILLSMLMIAAVIPAMPIFAAEDNKKPTADADLSKGMYVVGNGGVDKCGSDNWMHGAKWIPGEESNKMAQYSEKNFFISFTDLPKGDNYQIKYVYGGSWENINWGSEEMWEEDSPGAPYDGSGVKQNLEELGANIIVDTPFDDVTVDLIFQYNYNFYATNCSSIITVCSENGEPVGGYGEYEVDGDFWYRQDGTLVKYVGNDTNVKIPETFGDDIQVSSIGCGAFAGCDKIENVEIPDSVTLIASHAFTNCTSLKSFEIPSNVIALGSKVFSNCSNLEKLSISEGTTYLGDNLTENSEKVKIECVQASAAYNYAVENGIEMSERAPSPCNIILEGEENFDGLIAQAKNEEKTISRVFKDGKAIISGVYYGEEYTVTITTPYDRLIYSGDFKINKKKFVINQNDYREYYKNEVDPYHFLYSIPYELKVYGEYIYDEWDEGDYDCPTCVYELANKKIINKTGGYYEDITDECIFDWTINDKYTLNNQGPVLNHTIHYDDVKCKIRLKSSIAGKYKAPDEYHFDRDSYYTTTGEVYIQKYNTYSTKIKVSNESGNPVKNANISVVQEIDRNNNETQSLKTNENGEVTAELKELPTIVTASKSCYLKDSKSFTPDGGDVSLTLKKTESNSIVPVVTGTYCGGRKVIISADELRFELKNLTANKVIDDFFVENNIITIPQTYMSEGDELELKVIDESGVFEETAKTFKYSSSNKKVELSIVERGKISFSYTSENKDNMALIFDSDGEYVSTIDLSQSSTSEHLDGDNYTVVMIGSDNSINRVGSYSELMSFGLSNGRDFVLSFVTVDTGAIAEISGVKIPKLDLSGNNYVNQNGSYVYYSPEVTPATSYVMVTATYSLLDTLQENVQVKKASIKIPAGINMIDGVSVNNTYTENYSFSKNTLTVDVTESTGVIRFCIVPKKYVGSGQITCTLLLNAEGKSVVQPFGSTDFSVKENFNVEEIISDSNFAVSGDVSKKATVDVYADGKLANTVQANQMGYFRAPVTFEKTFNHTYHKIYFDVKSKNGNVYRSQTYDVEFKRDAVTVRSVTVSSKMIYTTKLFDRYGDFSKSYSVIPSDEDATFTFSVEFSGDTSKIQLAYLSIRTNSTLSNYIPLQRVGGNRFAASRTFNVGDLPRGYSVEYQFVESEGIDFDFLKDQQNEDNEFFDDINSQMSEIDALSNELSKEGQQELADLFSQYIDFDAYNLSTESKVTDQTDDSYTVQGGDGTKCTTKTWTDESKTAADLLSEGYEQIAAYGNNNLFSYTSDDGTIVADLSNHIFVANYYEEASSHKASYPTSADSSVNSTSSETWDTIKDELQNMMVEIADYADGFKKLAKDVEGLLSKVNKASIFARPLSLIIENFSGLLSGIGIWLSGTDYAESYYEFSSICAEADSLAYTFSVLKLGADSQNCAQNKVASIQSAINSLNSNINKYAYSLKAKWFSYLNSIAAFSLACLGFTTEGLGFIAAMAPALISAGVAITGAVIKDVYGPKIQKGIDSIKSQLDSLREALGSEECTTESETESTASHPTQPTTEKKRRKFDENITPEIDPSGYVCEAVSGNRLEGVKVTLFYSEYEDGRDAEIWDAEDYGQKNPLYTDANGTYQWFVPEGWWQVKYEKEGYMTAYSDWLPVPPPQLDVNVGMVSLYAPEVNNVKVYSDSVDITFSQYMKIDTINADTVKVSMDGKDVSGAIVPVNDEVSYKDSGVMYASKFRFTPESDTLSGNVTVTVDGVVNYTNSCIDEKFEDTYTVEGKVEKINADSEVSVDCSKAENVTISLAPAKAAAGKTVNITIVNDAVLKTDKQSVVTDENGEAKIKLTAQLPGEATVRYTLDGTDVSACTNVICTNENGATEPSETKKLEKVTASIASGTAVKKGTKVTLTNSNPDAVIYYTLDLSCPCQANNPARKLYTEPLVINEDTVIVAYAVLDGYIDSVNTVLVYKVEEEVPVTPVVNAPKINKTSANLKAGKTLTLKVSNAKVKKWLTSKKAVARVSSKGKITALKKGKATITAVLTNGKKLSCKVNVTTSPKLSKKSVTVKQGKTVTIKIIGKASKIKNVYIKNKKAKVISKKTAAKLKIKGLRKGKTTLKLKVNGVTLKLKVKVK